MAAKKTKKKGASLAWYTTHKTLEFGDLTPISWNIQVLARKWRESEPHEILHSLHFFFIKLCITCWRTKGKDGG